jgi:multiple sugar transport system substrate-binding protein
MKNKKKGVLAIIGFAPILSYVFISGLLTPLPKGGEYEEGVLRVWATWGDDPVHLQSLFDSYTQTTGQPIKVTTGFDSHQIEKGLSEDTPPDLVILSSNALVSSYYEQGLIEPLDPWIETAGIDLDDTYQAALAQCEMPDGIYTCLPWGADVFALFWNKDLFTATGLDPEHPPQTMEEMITYADLLTTRDEEGELIQAGFIPDFPRSYTIPYAHMFGGDLYDMNGSKPAANSQAMIDAMTWQRKFYDILGEQEADQFVLSINRYMKSNHPVFGGTPLNCQQCHRSDPPGKGKNIPDHGFYDGKVAMMVSGEWQLGPDYIAHFNPDLNYGVTPLPPPANHQEQANSGFVQGSVVIIPSGGLDKASAANLLAWLMLPETVAEISTVNTSLPTSQAAALDPRFQQIPYFQVFMDLMAGAGSSYNISTPISLELNTALGMVEKELLHKQGGEPASLLGELQAEFTQ